MKKELPKKILEFNLNMTDVDEMVSVTTYQTKYMNQLKKLADAHPDEVKVIKKAKENDGMMVVHLPKKYCKVSFGEVRVKREMTEDQKAAARERIKKMQEAKKAKAEAKKIEEEGWL